MHVSGLAYPQYNLIDYCHLPAVTLDCYLVGAGVSLDNSNTGSVRKAGVARVLPDRAERAWYGIACSGIMNRDSRVTKDLGNAMEHGVDTQASARRCKGKYCRDTVRGNGHCPGRLDQ